MNKWKYKWADQLDSVLPTELNLDDICLAMHFEQKMLEHIAINRGTVNPFPYTYPAANKFDEGMIKRRRTISNFVWNKLSKKRPMEVVQAS